VNEISKDPSQEDERFKNRLIEINSYVMLDLIRHPESIHIRIPGFRLKGRNDKSQSNNTNFASPEGAGFPPSPKRTLKI